MVDGDIIPSVVNRVAAFLAMPLTDIYNCISISSRWPMSWKVEYVTPIAKKTHPETVNDLRNIICAQLISKAYERKTNCWKLEIRTEPLSPDPADSDGDERNRET